MEFHGDLLSVGRSWSEQPMYDASYQLPDRQLRITTIHDPPYIYVHQQGDGSYTYDGYLYQLWETIASELNITYVMQPFLGLGFGSLAENGTWTGVVGELAYGRADVCLTWLQMRPDRRTVVDFLDAVAVTQAAPSFYIRHGSEAVPSVTLSMFNALLMPLHSDVWWLILTSLFVTSIALWVALRFNHSKAEDTRTVKEMTWHSCLLSSFMTLVNQGWASTPTSAAARIVTVSCWALSILIYTNYTANLISYLTTSTVDRPISSLKEFVEQPGWMFAIEPGHAVLNDWKRSSDPYERELYRRTETGDGYIRLDVNKESGRRTTEPYVMTYIDLDRLLFSRGAEACSLVPLNDRPVLKRVQYLAIAQGLGQTRQAINQLMQKLLQRGVLSRLQHFWLTGARDVCDHSASFKQMSVRDVLAVLAIMPIGLISCAAVFVIEHISFRVMSLRQCAYLRNAVTVYRRRQQDKRARKKLDISNRRTHYRKQ